MNIAALKLAVSGSPCSPAEYHEVGSPEHEAGASGSHRQAEPVRRTGRTLPSRLVGVYGYELLVQTERLSRLIAMSLRLA